MQNDPPMTRELVESVVAIGQRHSAHDISYMLTFPYQHFTDLVLNVGTRIKKGHEKEYMAEAFKVYKTHQQ